MTDSDVRCAGILLTGGASARFGRDKATASIGGATLAQRSARVLASVASPAIEVGPGVSGLAHVDDPREGPLVAFATGLDRVAAGPVLLLACDLPLVAASLLAWLAGHPAPGSVVPIAAGRPQPLCARWGGTAVERLPGLVAEGQRSLQPLLRLDDVVFVDEAGWLPHAGPCGRAALEDADTPEELDRLMALGGP